MTALPVATGGDHTSRLCESDQRIVELDGLRGVAILLVIWHHFTLIQPQTPFERWFVFTSHFGWIGVDLFFVLSGFLITGILLDSRTSPRYFTSFYARRVLRIFPAYYLLLLVSFIVLPAIMPERMAAAGANSDRNWMYWCFLSNIGIAADNAFENHLLAPTWSLAIEEQFYIVWPLVVLLIGPRGLRRLCPALIVGSYALRLLMLHAWDLGNTTVYVLTPCRLDGLAAGAWVATLVRGGWRADPLRRPLAAIAVLALMGAYGGEAGTLLASNESVYHRSHFALGHGISLLAVGFAALVSWLVASRAAPRLRQGLRHPILRSFGKYSYAIYLTHMPLRAAIRDLLLGPSEGGAAPLVAFSQLGSSPWVGQLCFYVLAIALSWCLGWLSWHCYEQWFLRLKRFFPY